MEDILEFKNETAYLSNFWECPVVFDGLRYGSSEAAFQAQKCLERAHEFIFLTPDESKKLGRKVEMRKDWDEVKDDIMYEIVKAKFTQNEDLREKLLATGDAYLAEGNWWRDSYWGVYQGKGLNKLGNILMRVRAEFRK